MTDDQPAQAIENVFSIATSERAERISEELAELTSMCFGDEEAALRERIYSLTNNALGERQSEVFDGLCRQISRAYGTTEPTDAQVLANSATPHLVRYLIGALHSFHDRDRANGEPPGRTLARAMLAVNPHGAPGKLKEREIAMVVAASAARAAAIRRRCDPDGANEAAIEAAYIVFRRGESGTQEEKEYLLTILKIKKLLLAEGVLASLS